MPPDLPEVGRRGSVAGFRAALRFLRTDGGYHAAALTYYLIFALFPAGALIYALLGIFGAESVVDDVAEELDERGFDHEYVNTVRETITAAVTQRSDKALIVVAISVVSAIYVASQWVRGVRRGLDAVLERQHCPAGLSRDLRDALALVLLFSLAMLLQFGGAGSRRMCSGALPSSGRRCVPARGDRRDVRLRLHLRGRRRAAAPAAHRAWGGLGRDHAPLVCRNRGLSRIRRALARLRHELRRVRHADRWADLAVAHERVCPVGGTLAHELGRRR